MNYHDIKKCDMLNGDGIRVSLWVSGCEHNCNQCQNPQTWAVDSGISFDVESKKELLKALEKKWISGITFSGGDPLNNNNLQEVLNLIEEIKRISSNKTIWLYTGYTWEEIMKYEFGSEYIKDDNVGYWNCDALRQIIVSKCDVLVDGRYEEDKRDITLRWRGSSNQRVIDVQQSIKDNKVVLYCQ